MTPTAADGLTAKPLGELRDLRERVFALHASIQRQLNFGNYAADAEEEKARTVLASAGQRLEAIDAEVRRRNAATRNLETAASLLGVTASSLPVVPKVEGVRRTRTTSSTAKGKGSSGAVASGSKRPSDVVERGTGDEEKDAVGPPFHTVRPGQRSFCSEVYPALKSFVRVQPCEQCERSGKPCFRQVSGSATACARCHRSRVGCSHSVGRSGTSRKRARQDADVDGDDGDDPDQDDVVDTVGSSVARSRTRRRLRSPGTATMADLEVLGDRIVQGFQLSVSALRRDLRKWTQELADDRRAHKTVRLVSPGGSDHDTDSHDGRAVEDEAGRSPTAAPTTPGASGVEAEAQAGPVGVLADFGADLALLGVVVPGDARPTPSFASMEASGSGFLPRVQWSEGREASVIGEKSVDAGQPMEE